MANAFTLLGVSIVVFLLLRMVPGTIIDAMMGATTGRSPEFLSSITEFFGLDVPLHVQYLRWIGDILRGDLGISWRSGKPVLELILAALPLTLELTFLAMLITLLVGIPAGVICAVRKDSWLDNVGRLISLTGLGLPNYWQGAMMILLASKVLHWMPPLEFVSPFEDPLANLTMLVLPAIALGTVNVANVMRLTRSSLLEVLSNDYIRTARAKGLKERVVLYRHALKNSLVTVITVAGMMMGYLFGGAVTVEAVFILPGLGRLILWSIYQRDYPVTQGALLVISAMFLLSNLLVDILYVLVDPRVEYT